MEELADDFPASAKPDLASFVAFPLAALAVQAEADSVDAVETDVYRQSALSTVPQSRSEAVVVLAAAVAAFGFPRRHYLARH